MHDLMVDLQRYRATSEEKKFIERIKDPIFLEVVLATSKRDNVRAPTQLGRESQPQYLKILFFLKNRPIYFHINSTSVIRLVKQNHLRFAIIEINKPLSDPVYSVSQIRLKFRGQLQLLPDALSHSEQRVVSSAQIAILQITSGMLSVYSRKGLRPRIDP